ncbi:MAG: hypothetical protein WCY92_02715 [Novosphingobium sp.]|uniref:hypothetical protein n=1 Tax=Tsuneonella sp. CC-YZS046 TaxID=3042152 RepID=UPI002D769B0B|nr:hypothetical protein [Tsuneonella sp. CC-YZS046]WRO65489.1 hypothetical protein U8326_10495 [Tsuneonella sp. CC-YZS046]
MDANKADGAGDIRQQRAELTEADLTAAGIDLVRDYPGQSLADLRQYPVLSEGGWFIVIKNQKTLQEISRRPWRLLGPVELLSNSLDLD